MHVRCKWMLLRIVKLLVVDLLVVMVLFLFFGPRSAWRAGQISRTTACLRQRMIYFFGFPTAVRGLHVGPGGWVQSESVDHDEVDRGVRLPVSAAVPAVTSSGAGAGGMGRGAAESGERALGPDTVRVVPGGGQQLCGGWGFDAEWRWSPVRFGRSARSAVGLCRRSRRRAATRRASRRSAIVAAAAGSTILVSSTRSCRMQKGG